MSRKAIVAVILSAALLGMDQVGFAGEADDYLRDVKPILTKRCYACHGALKQAAGLRLDTASSLLASVDDQPKDQPLRKRLGHLLIRLRSHDPAEQMPPEGNRLSASEIEAIEKWIDSGAPAPLDEQPQSDPLRHWAFVPPVAAALPAGTFNHPIDRLLEPNQTKIGVTALGPASKRTLLRRATLDLIGLPPTPDEMTEFLSDESPDAYERVVDRLLNRPEYGERWGRHWMDVWRYSDWYGRRSVPDVMNSYPQIWRWRDWIIRSLNEDKGYDRMIMEMLAADELFPEEPDNVVATGFIVRNWYKWNYETWMKDNVEHTSKAFLGLTMNCAMCHDHKYDPISQDDYFRFRAFFEPLELRHDRVAGEADPGPFKKYVYAQSYGPIQTGAIRVFDEKLDAQTFAFRGGDARNRIEGKPPIEPGPPVSLSSPAFGIHKVDLPTETAYPGLRESVRRDERSLRQQKLSAAQNAVAAAVALTAKTEETLKQAASQQTSAAANLIELQLAIHDAQASLSIARLSERAALQDLLALEARIAADDAAYRGQGDKEQTAKAACLSEKLFALASAEQARAAAEQAVVKAERPIDDSDPAKKNAHEKHKQTVHSNLSAASAAVTSARAALATVTTEYKPLSEKYPTQSTGRRTALARWIASESNPLTARVAVNHIWMRHFGRPLVESVDNFGIQGKSPSHPELLDHLALELMSHGWSMKRLHRLILTSDAYRRASFESPSTAPTHWQRNTERDRDNLSYWHFPQQRMQAEVVRDSVLACAEALDRSVGGKEIETSQWSTSMRRSLYFSIHGESQMTFLNTFDGANVCDCYRRQTTVLPAQALAMTNSELTVEFGRRCAAVLQQKGKSSGAEEVADDEFIRLAFEQILQRPPIAAELVASIEFLNQQRAGSSLSASDAKDRARENLVIALFSHNDFVTIR